MVPSDAFSAFLDYYTAASQQVGCKPAAEFKRCTHRWPEQPHARTAAAPCLTFEAHMMIVILSSETGLHPPPCYIQVKANTSLTIMPCNATVMCGHSTPAGSDAAYACQSIDLPDGASAADVAAAQETLLAMYPASVDVLLAGGAVAPLPGAVLVNDCSGPGNTGTAGVAACSYMRVRQHVIFRNGVVSLQVCRVSLQLRPAATSLPAMPTQGPVGNLGQNFWVASPFFTGRFVQFNVSGSAADVPGGGSDTVGVMRFSGPISSCSF